MSRKERGGEDRWRNPWSPSAPRPPKIPAFWVADGVPLRRLDRVLSDEWKEVSFVPGTFRGPCKGGCGRRRDVTRRDGCCALCGARESGVTFVVVLDEGEIPGVNGAPVPRAPYVASTSLTNDTVQAERAGAVT